MADVRICDEQVFYVIDGAVTFKVHESSYVLCAGGMILVPRGNTYYIENIAERDAKLFFAQARRVSAEEEAPPEVLPALDHEPTTTPHRRRSNSIGQAPVTARLSSEKAAPGKRAASARS
jgi:centromere protein C